MFNWFKKKPDDPPPPKKNYILAGTINLRFSDTGTCRVYKAFVCDEDLYDRKVEILYDRKGSSDYHPSIAFVHKWEAGLTNPWSGVEDYTFEFMELLRSFHILHNKEKEIWQVWPESPYYEKLTLQPSPIKKETPSVEEDGKVIRVNFKDHDNTIKP